MHVAIIGAEHAPLFFGIPVAKNLEGINFLVNL